MRVSAGLVLCVCLLAACGDDPSPATEATSAFDVELALGNLDRPVDATPSVDGSEIF